MAEFSTSLHHVFASDPNLARCDEAAALTWADPAGLGPVFAKRVGLEFLGLDPDRRGFMRFKDGNKSIRDVFGTVEFLTTDISYYLAIRSGQALKANTIPADLRPEALLLTRSGVSPKHKREAHSKLPVERQAVLVRGLLRATGNIDVGVTGLPVSDTRYHDTLVISGKLPEISKACMAFQKARCDDRNPKRDGSRLQHQYAYSGDPWNNEIMMSFHDRYGMQGMGKVCYPLVLWERPGERQFDDHLQAEQHLQDVRNYGFRVMYTDAEGKGHMAGPFYDLPRLLTATDGVVSALTQGQRVTLPEPSAEDLKTARHLFALRQEGRPTFTRQIDDFLARNGVGLKAQTAALALA